MPIENRARRSFRRLQYRLTNERSRFLRAIVYTMAAIAATHFLVALATGVMREIQDAAGHFVFGLFMYLALTLIKKGRVLIAGTMLCGSVYLGVMATALLHDGNQTSVATGLIVFTLVTGFSMGSRAGALAAVLVMISLITITTLDLYNMLPPPMFTEYSPAATATMVALSLAQAGILIWYGLKRLETAMHDSESKEAETRESLLALSATREDNEKRASQGDALAQLAEEMVRLRSPETLRMHAVEALNQTLQVSGAALIGVGKQSESLFSVGLESSSDVGTPVPAIQELSRKDGPTGIAGVENVQKLLSPLYKNASHPWLFAAPVRSRLTRNLLIAVSDRELNPSELSFLLTVANLLGGLRERQQVEAELRQAQKMEAVGQISGSVAHDFNNLLGAILGSAELLDFHNQEHPDEQSERMTKNIIRAAEHASMLTRQLLAFTRRRPEQIEVHDLRPVLNNLSELLDRLSGERIVLTTKTCEIPVPVETDKGNIEQVLFNLVSNARDAIPGNGKIHISLEVEDESTALLRVSDTGSGMPANVIKRIFEPFFTTKGEGRGTGIGLATVRRIVDDLDGTIQVESTQGKGTQFNIRFPLSVQRFPSERPTRFTPSESPYAANILLLDDNAMVRTTTRAMLESAGHNVKEGSSAQDGITLLSKNKDIDLILSDIIMPGMSGVELLEEIRARNIDAPVILMTGYTDPDLDRQSEALASATLRKPVSHFDLVSTINEVLETTLSPPS